MTDLETPDTRGSVEMSASRQRHCSCTMERQAAGDGVERVVGTARRVEKQWEAAEVIAAVISSTAGETGRAQQ